MNTAINISAETGPNRLFMRVPLGIVAPGSQICQVTRSGVVNITSFMHGDGGTEKDPEWLHMKEYIRNTALGVL
jgi:hypothetical protein